MPAGSVATHLRKAIDDIEFNAFTKELNLPEEKAARRILVAGGVLNALIVGGIAMGASQEITMKASAFIGVPTIAVSAVCGGIGAGAFGLWAAIKFGEVVSKDKSAAAGFCILAGCTIAGIAAAPVVATLAGTGILVLGSGAWMAQAVGFGGFKMALVVLEPTLGWAIASTAQYLAKCELEKIEEGGGSSRLEQIKKKENQRDNQGEITKKDWEKLHSFAMTPLSDSWTYFYNEIFNPPMHEELKNFKLEDGTQLLHYVDWGPNPEKKESFDPFTSKTESSPQARLYKAYSEIDVKQSFKSACESATACFASMMQLLASTKAEAEKTIEQVAVGEKVTVISPKEPVISPKEPGIVMKSGYMVWHATATAFHRITAQAFRAHHSTDEAEAVFSKLKELAEEGKFTSTAQAWENFNQIERRFGGAIDENNESNLIKQARKAIEANYGPRRGFWEVASCGWSTGARLEALKAKLNTAQDVT